jgi:hypothetical protein
MNKYVAGGLMPSTPKPSPDNVQKYGDDALQCFMETAREKVKAWLQATNPIDCQSASK